MNVATAELYQISALDLSDVEGERLSPLQQRVVGTIFLRELNIRVIVKSTNSRLAFHDS